MTPKAATHLYRSFLFLLLLPSVVAADLECRGDCGGDGPVAVEDLVLAAADPQACGALAPDSNGVDASALRSAIHSALAGCIATHWQPRRNLPQARQELAVAELAGKVYVIGGIDTRFRTLALVEVYDPQTDQWSAVAPLPQALHHVVAASVGDRLYAIGGLQTLQFIAVDTLYEYDPQGDEWKRRADLPAARGAGAAAVIDAKIYVAGGLRQGSVDDFAVYDPALDQWEILPAMPSARDHLGAAAIGGAFYAVGGRAQSLYAALEVFDPVQRAWSTRSPMPTARGGLAVAALNGLLFAMGGEGNPNDVDGIFHETEAYDPVADRWRRLPDMRTPRHGTGAAVAGEAILVPGGATVASFGATAVCEALVP